MTQSLGKSRAAVVLAFIVCGMMFGSWASRIPAIKDQAGLDSVHLGFALLGSPLGSVLAMTFAGYAAGRFGSHRITVLMLLVCAAALPLIASASSFFHLAGALFIFGAAYGSMDVCMNANGLAIERAGHSPIMSRLHACWSIGSFIGAFSTTIALQAGLSVFQQFSILAVAMVATAIVLSRTMLPERHASSGAIFTRPPRRLVLVGFVALCALIAEGSAGDWSGVFIKDNIGGTAQQAALAITFLSATMAGVRLAGDRLTQILGPARLVSLGAVVSALGMLMALVIAQPIAAIVGFGFVGMGVAATYPIALRAAGSQPGIASSVGIAAVATMGSAGVMAAPPLIGSVAGAAGLRMALGMIVVLLVVLAATAGRAVGSTRIAGPEPAVPLELP
jgi:Na+/melibiose symporter-like transporter